MLGHSLQLKEAAQVIHVTFVNSDYSDTQPLTMHSEEINLIHRIGYVSSPTLSLMQRGGKERVNRGSKGLRQTQIVTKVGMQGSTCIQGC